MINRPLFSTTDHFVTVSAIDSIGGFPVAYPLHEANYETVQAVAEQCRQLLDAFDCEAALIG